jgi:cobalt-zinc-cadmium efflux system outer membrane protein
VRVTRRYRLLGEARLGVETEQETDDTQITGPSLALELPVFNQGHGRVARAEAELQRAEAELGALQTRVSNAIVAAHADVLAAKARAQVYRETLIPQREAIVQRLQEQVNFMLAGQFELLRAKQQEYDAYQGYFEALRDYWQARTELTRHVGTVLPSQARVEAGSIGGEAAGEPEPTSEHEQHHDHGETQ